MYHAVHHAVHTTTLVIIITHYSRVLSCRCPSLLPFFTFPLAPRNNARKLDSLSFFKTRFATTFESILKQQDISTNNKRTTTKGQYTRHHCHPPIHTPPIHTHLAWNSSSIFLPNSMSCINWVLEKQWKKRKVKYIQHCVKFNIIRHRSYLLFPSKTWSILSWILFDPKLINLRWIRRSLFAINLSRTNHASLPSAKFSPAPSTTEAKES